MLAQGQSSTAKRGGLALVSTGLIFFTKKRKENVVHIYNGILFSNKKEKILPLAMSCMDLEVIMLSEITETEKDKYHLISVIHTIWLFSFSPNCHWQVKLSTGFLFFFFFLCEGDQPWASIRANRPLFAEEDQLWANIYCQSSSFLFFFPKAPVDSCMS